MNRSVLHTAVSAALLLLLAVSVPASTNLPARVNGWRLRSKADDPLVVYGRKNRDLTRVLAEPLAAFRDATGSGPARGLIIVTEGARDASLLFRALQGHEGEVRLPEGMDFGDDIAPEQVFAMIPFPLPREAVAKLLGTDAVALADLEWFLALPSERAQKQAMKELMKGQMKEEGVNVAMRLLIRPFLGKIVGMAVEALQPASQIMLMQQWLDASGLPGEEAASILDAFESAVTAEMEERLEGRTRDLEATAEALSTLSPTNTAR